MMSGFPSQPPLLGRDDDKRNLLALLALAEKSLFIPTSSGSIGKMPLEVGAVSLDEMCLNRICELGYPMLCSFLSVWLVASLLTSPDQKTIHHIQELLTSSQTTFEQFGNHHGMAWALINQARVCSLLGKQDAARHHYRESLEILQEMDDYFFVCLCLEELAVLSLSSPKDAVCYLAEASTIRMATGMEIQPIFQVSRERVISQLHLVFPDFEQSPEWVQGQRAAQSRLAKLAPVQQRPLVVKDPSMLPLTQRQKDTLALVARGFQNKEIARALNVSPRTVHAHLQAIYAKLGVNTRAAVTRIAILHRLTDD